MIRATVRPATARGADSMHDFAVMFRKTHPDRSADPLRIWLEEIMGPALPPRGSRREAAIAELMRDGGRGVWRQMRSAS